MAIQDYIDSGLYEPRSPYVSQISGTSLLIGWYEPMLSGSIFGYRVYRAESYDAIYSGIGATTSLTYIDSGLSQDINYYYRIRSLY